MQSLLNQEKGATMETIGMIGSVGLGFRDPKAGNIKSFMKVPNRKQQLLKLSTLPVAQKPTSLQEMYCI